MDSPLRVRAVMINPDGTISHGDLILDSACRPGAVDRWEPDAVGLDDGHCLPGALCQWCRERKARRLWRDRRRGPR